MLTGRKREGRRQMETVRSVDVHVVLSLRSVLEFQVKKKIHSSFRNVRTLGKMAESKEVKQ